MAGWSDRADSDLRPVHVTVDTRGQHSFDWRGARVTLAGPGRHLVQNALLALAMAELFAVEPGEAAAGVSSVQPGWMRGQVEGVGGLTLLLDCYNANPLSVRAALDLLELQTEAPRRVAVLGSMLELGEQSQALHTDVLRDALSRKVDLVVAIGAFAAAASRIPPVPGSPEVLAVESPLTAYARLKEYLVGDEAILLKASRGVELESIMPKIREDFGGSSPAVGAVGTH